MSESTTHNVIVRKASISLMAGESVQSFTKALSEACKKSMKAKLGTSDKDSLYVVDVYSNKAVFEVYKSGGGETYYMAEWKRDAKGMFSFDMPKQVMPIRQYAEVAGVKKNTEGTGDEGDFAGWQDVTKSGPDWAGVL